MHENASENEAGLLTFTAAARELRVRAHTVGDLVIALGIEPKPMSNARAKGLDRADMARLRALLCGDRRAATATTS